MQSQDSVMRNSVIWDYKRLYLSENLMAATLEKGLEFKFMMFYRTQKKKNSFKCTYLTCMNKIYGTHK
jgi:hypothetical protein